jgi:hypothetical protein
VSTSFNPNNISFSGKNKVNTEVMGSRLERGVCGCDVGETHENRSVCPTDISRSKRESNADQNHCQEAGLLGNSKGKRKKISFSTENYQT